MTTIDGKLKLHFEVPEIWEIHFDLPIIFKIVRNLAVFYLNVMVKIINYKPPLYVRAVNINYH